MGNCVGHNLHNAKNKQDAEHMNKAQLNKKPQEAAKQKIRSGITISKGNSDAHFLFIREIILSIEAHQ